MSFYTFQPVYQSRIWGGQNLKRLFERNIPENARIGESWELVDRPEAQSVWTEDGKTTLHDLWASAEREKIFGTRAPQKDRFPILIKILDAQEKLSVQVHPPLKVAEKFHGEPKTEMWYFLDTTENAEIYAGLKRGVTRASFEQALAKKKIAECIHALPTKPYEAMLLPAGRIHAIGGGNVLLEIQQNSDTTYRVDDWNRADANGKPRELHVEQALECIRFDDWEPYFIQPHGERVVKTDFFEIRRISFFEKEMRDFQIQPTSFQYWFITQGELKFLDREWEKGQTVFLTADSGALEVEALSDYAEAIITTFPL
ncbi:MAG: type I phosphomannose isomerase catalytic subunit [Verrucomicrobiota bacterium]